MMNKPIITIIVPVYEVEKCLDRCVISLINQSFKDIEIILVNDGSPDNCPAMCDEYAKEDDRIRVIHKKNGGLSDARNVGLLSATGLYVMFVDSDDYIENNACEKFVNLVVTQEVDVVVGAAKKMTSFSTTKMMSSEKLHNIVLSGPGYLKHELRYNYVRMASVLNLYRRNFLLENNLFFKVGLLHEDEQWTPRVFLVARKVYISNIYFYNYIIRENSITKTNDFRKNAKHISSTVLELNDLYDSLYDKDLKRLLKDYLIGIYLFAYRKGKLYELNEEYTFKKFVLFNSSSLITRIKSIAFFISPRLYSILGNLKS